MNVITFFSTNAQVGSSTLTELIAVNIVEHFNLKCAVVDACRPDYPISKKRAEEIEEAKTNQEQREVIEKLILNNTVLEVMKAENPKQLISFLDELRAQEFDLVFLDIPKEIDGSVLHYLAQCNFIFIPLTTNKDHFKPSIVLYKQLKELEALEDTKDMRLIMNKVKENKSEFTLCYSILEEAESMGIKIFDTPITFYNNYKRGSTLEASLKNYQKNDQYLKGLMFDIIDIAHLENFDESESIIQEENEQYFE